MASKWRVSNKKIQEALGPEWVNETGLWQLNSSKQSVGFIKRLSGSWVIDAELELDPVDPERAFAACHLLALAEKVANGEAAIPRFHGEDCLTESEMQYALGRDEERAAVAALLEKDHGRMVANRIRRAEHWAEHECKDEGPCR